MTYSKAPLTGYAPSQSTLRTRLTKDTTLYPRSSITTLERQVTTPLTRMLRTILQPLSKVQGYPQIVLSLRPMFRNWFKVFSKGRAHLAELIQVISRQVYSLPASPAQLALQVST